MIETIEQVNDLHLSGKLLNKFHVIDNQVYHDSFGVSHSNIKEIFDPCTPQNFKIKLKTEREQTEAMKIGTACHMAVFDFDDFVKKVKAEPEVNKRTKAGKEELAKFYDENREKLILAPNDLDRIEGIAESVQNNEIVSKLLNDSQHNLIEMAAWFKWHNVICKFKPDFFNIKKNLIIDLKTTNAGHFSAFQKSIRDYNYDTQAALYLRGMKEITGNDYRFLWIVVEKFPPYNVYLWYPAERMLDQAELKLINALELISDCEENKFWPGVPKEALEIDFTNYYYRNLESIEEF